jgi:hypothetical protein
MAKQAATVIPDMYDPFTAGQGHFLRHLGESLTTGRLCLWPPNPDTGWQLGQCSGEPTPHAGAALGDSSRCPRCFQTRCAAQKGRDC